MTPMTMLKCIDCGAIFQVQTKWFRSRSKDHEWRCKPCRVKYHKLWYKNMSPEKQKEVHERMSLSAAERWKNMSSDEYKEMCSKMSAGDRKYWDNLSNDEYIARCISAQTMWNNMTEEQRLQQSMNISKMQILNWKNMPKDKYIYRCKLLSAAARKYWENISDAELAARRTLTSDRFKKYWVSMTKDEFNLWKLKQSKGFNEYLENLGLKPNTNEMNFIEYLKEININWIYQYSNMFIDKEFDKLFPYNPILDSSNVNPYHKWDFMINLYSSKILIDIDGSIHDPSKTSYEVTYPNGKKFILSDYILFKDSQRPYQTDGYRSFVVKCYDDKLDLDNEVIDITNNNKMTLKEFLTRIKIENNVEYKRNNIHQNKNS